jgi:hypothetical protein
MRFKTAISPNGLLARSANHATILTPFGKVNLFTKYKPGRFMKNIKLIALLGGLLASSAVMAALEPAPDYTLTTSANLLGNYSFYDSGVYNSESWYFRGYTNEVDVTTASILGTHRDSQTNQWYQTTQYTRDISYDYSYSIYGSSRRDLSVSVGAAAPGDQWLDLSLSTSNSMNNYSISAYGTPGSRTTMLGLAQSISPALGQVIDGSLSQSPSNYLYQGSWQAWTSGRVDNTFRAVAEATDGGAINSLSVSLSSDPSYVREDVQHYSYNYGSWTQDVAISAPVPEPESWAMMMAGLGLMGAVARRRRKSED